MSRICFNTTRSGWLAKLANRLVRDSALLCATAVVASAVYAPIPLLEQGRPFTVYLGSGVYFDSNIFGAETGRIQSMDFQLAPAIAFNASVAKQTFVSFNYRLSLDYMPDRPGKQLLDSHELVARVAHTFSPETEIDLSDSYQISKNPESLLPGIGTVLSGDQSYRKNQADARLSTGLTRRTGLLFKARATAFAYDSAPLASELDRNEFIGGVTAEHTLLPTLKSTLEYRYQLIQYGTGGERKDKQSNFLLGGFDYALNEKLGASGRAGLEYRQRKGDRDTLAPYVEIGAKRDYAKGSFVSIGYSHSYEENSTIELFTDTVVNRFFLNWQHVLTPKIIATGSLNWEPSVLRGRRGISPNRDETNTRAGLALIYRPISTWSVSATVDVDRVQSEEPGRGLNRNRYGLSARSTF